MKLPFSAEEFLGVFTRYNSTIGWLPILAYVAAFLMLMATARRTTWADRFTSIGLAAMWAWTGIVYHGVFFHQINPAAVLFGAAFVAQAVALAAAGLRGRLRFRLTVRGVRGRMGHLMVLFSMIVYPILGTVSGHAYPNGPVFGLTPCPLVIFTFGMLLFTDADLPTHLVIVPLLWALIGSTAALGLGIREDTGLLVSGLIATTVLLLRRSADSVRSKLAADAGTRPTRRPFAAAN